MEDFLIISSKEIFKTPKTKEKIDKNSFTILTLIGKGAFGKVYLVKKKDTNRIYAMKSLKKKKIEVLKQINHIKTERHILGEINHPFIVKLCFAYQTETNLNLILEYCPGGELYSLLQKKGTFKEEHLKPENILIDQDGYIKLTDFGLSKRVPSSDKKAYTFCGTPEYFAPEQIKRQEGHGKPVDWWSYGSVIYEMMTGLPAFFHSDKNKLYEKIMNEKLMFPKNFNPIMADFLEKLLEKNPEKRLGCGILGEQEIKKHKWFASIDWESLLKKEIKPPFKPILKSEVDTSYFDPQFTEELEENYANTFQSDESSLIEHNNNFEGFSYNLSLQKSNEEHKKNCEISKSNSLVESSYDLQSLGSSGSGSSNMIVFEKGEEITMEIEENEFTKVSFKK